MVQIVGSQWLGRFQQILPFLLHFTCALLILLPSKLFPFFQTKSDEHVPLKETPKQPPSWAGITKAKNPYVIRSIQALELGRHTALTGDRDLTSTDKLAD